MFTCVVNNILDDNDFLQCVISHTDAIVQAVPNQLLCIKNLESIVVYFSQPFADFLNVEIQQIIGTVTISSLYDDHVNTEKMLIHEENIVISSRQSQTILKVNIVGKDLKPYLCIKSPVINPATNNVVGVLTQGIEHGMINFQTQLLHSESKINHKPSHKQLPHLNRREKQVIFFFMSNLSSQQIADVLYQLDGKRITKGTIDSVFNDQLYIKFDVNSRIGLYNKLLKFGFDKKIPQEILSSKSSFLEQIETY